MPGVRGPESEAQVFAILHKISRRRDYREAEDLIRHYAPARLLCGLTETDWTPDHNTLHDYATLLGEDGMRLFNEYAVELAVQKKLASTSCPGTPFRGTGIGSRIG